LSSASILNTDSNKKTDNITETQLFYKNRIEQHEKLIIQTLSSPI